MSLKENIYVCVYIEIGRSNFQPFKKEDNKVDKV